MRNPPLHIPYCSVAPSTAKVRAPRRHPDANTDYCRVLKARADRCYDDHHQRWAPTFGTPLYATAREHVRASSSKCFALAKRVVMECGDGVTIFRRGATADPIIL